ncbi:hypothetical protein JCM21900_006626 [Sporobolomyces salmonicolor]
MPFQQPPVPSPTLSRSPPSVSPSDSPALRSSPSLNPRSPPTASTSAVGLGVSGAGQLEAPMGGVPAPESKADVTSPVELTQLVDTLLNDLESRFDSLSSDVLSRLSSLSTRVDSLESSLAELMGDTAGVASGPGSSTGSAA